MPLTVLFNIPNGNPWALHDVLPRLCHSEENRSMLERMQSLAQQLAEAEVTKGACMLVMCLRV